MKLLHTLILSFLVSSLFANVIPEQNIKSTVNEVTVFLKGAQVTRKKNVELKNGVSTLKFVNLSPFIDEKSIQVKANGNLIVLSVNHQKNYMSLMKQSNEIESLTEQKEAVDDKLELEQTHLSIIREELDFLKANRQIGGKNETLPLSNLQQTASYYGKRFSELKLKEIAHNKQLKTLKEEVEQLERQINIVSGKKHFHTGEVLVKVDAKQAGKAKFELSYLVGNAGWFPSYDIRAKNISEPVQIIYKANLRQDTKVDWRNARLTFSSSDPEKSGIAPQLQAYYLNYNSLPPSYEQRINEVSGIVMDDNNEPLPGANVYVQGTTIGTVTNVDGSYTLTVPDRSVFLNYSFIGFETKTLPITSNRLNVRLNTSAADLDEVIVTGYGGSKSSLRGSVAGIKKEKAIKIRGAKSLAIPMQQVRKQTTVDFKVKRPYSIPSDNKNYVVDMAAYELNSNYQYYCVPKIDTDAFLVAQVSNWEQYNLLEGEANIFFEDTYIGKTLLDVRYANDTLDISLGRDKQVMVARKEVDNFTSKQFIGNKKQERKAWKTTIRNNKHQPINMIVLDQVPVSTLDEIEVKIEALSNGELVKPTGEVSWKMELAPSENKELELRYSVKYPKNRGLVIE